jgi:hypothetical protein
MILVIDIELFINRTRVKPMDDPFFSLRFTVHGAIQKEWIIHRLYPKPNPLIFYNSNNHLVVGCSTYSKYCIVLFLIVFQIPKSFFKIEKKYISLK